MPRHALLSAIGFLSWGVALFAIVAYAFLPFGVAVHPVILPGFLVQQDLVLTHAFAASVALLLGPWQFANVLRQRHPRWHRRAGAVYLFVGVGIGGVSGLWLAHGAFGGPVSQAGFGLLAGLWLWTGAMALARVWRGDIDGHRRWILRNCALTFAAVTLRFELPLALVAGVPLEVAYPAVAWLCWVPNLLLVEVLRLRRAGMRPRGRVRQQHAAAAR